MPMYEYKCDKCEAIVEDLVPIGTLTIKCPKCEEGVSKKGFWTKRSAPAIKTSDGFKTDGHSGGPTVDRKKMKEHYEDGIPFGEVPGDEQYSWIEDDTQKNGPLP